MKKQTHILFAVILVDMMIAYSCSSLEAVSPTSTQALPTVTSTPDPCAPENIRSEVDKVNKFMREFDDASMLAPYIPQESLYPVISDLQRIRRSAEDQSVPSCLATVKEYQLAHMNTVINTMVYLLSKGVTTEAEVVDQNIALARQQHDQYTLELANLLGVTVITASPENLTPVTPVAATAIP